MSTGVKIIKDVIIAFVLTSISVILYYLYYPVNNNSFFVALCSSFVRSIVSVIVLHLIEKACKDNSYSAGAFLLYSCLIYNQISVIKYSVNVLYHGAINDLYLRILGSLFIDFVLIFSSVIYYYYHRRCVKRNSNYFKAKDFNISFLIIYPFVAIYAMINFFYTKNVGGIISIDVSRTMRTFITAFTYFVYALTIIYVKKEDGKFKYSSFFPLIIIAVVNLYITMVTGKKNIFIVFGVVIVCGLLLTKKIQFKHFKYIAFASAIFYQLIQISSEALSSRTWYNIEYLMQYHAYRFDLSDLATTISLDYSRIANPFNIILESIKYAIPSFIYSEKNLELSNYINSMNAVGLDGSFDFNDTFFSMGAQIGGFFGIIVVFVIILLFFEWLNSRLLSIKNGIGVLIVLIPYFATSESDWSMFIYQTRDLIIYILVSYLIFYFSIKEYKYKGECYDIFNCS